VVARCGACRHQAVYGQELLGTEAEWASVLGQAQRMPGRRGLLVDVMCGVGRFVALARRVGWEACVYDVSPRAVQAGIALRRPVVRRHARQHGAAPSLGWPQDNTLAGRRPLQTGLRTAEPSPRLTAGQRTGHYPPVTLPPASQQRRRLRKQCRAPPVVTMCLTWSNDWVGQAADASTCTGHADRSHRSQDGVRGVRPQLHEVPLRSCARRGGSWGVQPLQQCYGYRRLTKARRQHRQTVPITTVSQQTGPRRSRRDAIRGTMHW